MSDAPISDYALLSDCHGSALVHRAGSIDWLCMKRFDSPAVFARLLDERAGCWTIQPAGEFSVTRRYLDESMILETTFRTDSGTLVVTDAMDIETDASGHDLGTGAANAVLREIECTEGTVEVEILYRPRPEYGLIAPIVTRRDGALIARGGAMILHLSSSLDLETHEASASAVASLEAGDTHHFALQCASPLDDDLPEPWSPETIEARIEASLEAWREWSDLHQSYEGGWAEQVHHSGRVLQAMIFAPTGALIAAPTTSLPEQVGGERNWDYRYTWVRDASLTLDALWVAACPDEADMFFDFMAHAALSQFHRSDDMQIMFGIAGEHDLSEHELPHLRGWRDSRPVRVGNGAWNQRQLDVYGELLAAAHRLRDQLTDLDATTRRFLAHLADLAAERWRQKDQGIWEMRGAPKHFVYSKLMCWVALDRAIELADMLEASDRVDRWRETRETIRETILDRGWSDQIEAFTQTFEGEALDASNAMIPIVEFLPGDDPRVVSTLDAIEDRLTDSGLVYRYRTHDGLEGEEGTFLLCTFWLAHARAIAGQVDRATELCRRGAEYLNDVGLLAEEVDPETGELLGNFPQAFSHMGLVNAAWAIDRAQSET